MPKALIVDDSHAMRKILSRHMRHLGYSSVTANDGEQGLRELESDGNDIDVALVDWNMPGMDGLAMTERVRANPETKDKKIVMVSTECEPRRIAKALLAGVDEYVMKPFTEDILSDKLELIGAPVQR